MGEVVSIEQARTLLGQDVFGPQEVRAVFGPVPSAERAQAIPFTRDELVAAARAGEMLVLRAAHTAAGTALTILEMVRRFPQMFDDKLLRQMGYQLKDEWGIEREPLAGRETCTPGWALVRKEVLDGSRNVSYEEQDAAIRQHAVAVGAQSGAVRRRSAVEAVYDTVVYCGVRQMRLLESTWDWTLSRTLDGGYLNVGGFGSRGMQILSFSRAVRHGGLGVCPTRQPAVAE